jgi:hypothetical protein
MRVLGHPSPRPLNAKRLELSIASPRQQLQSQLYLNVKLLSVDPHWSANQDSQQSLWQSRKGARQQRLAICAQRGG